MIEIDRATASDAEIIAELIGEIEEYYGGENVPGDLDQVKAALFGDQPMATVLLARDSGTVVGMASYSFLWPAAGAESSLYMKELFVREPARRRGVAKSLMDAIRTAASDARCSRVEWAADTDNPPALAFYKALGVKPHDDKVFYRMAD
jgi:GNAT superfamily N-acetyltransferase